MELRGGDLHLSRRVAKFLRDTRVANVVQKSALTLIKLEFDPIDDC